MLIADSLKLIFIHIQRTGGTSLSCLLQDTIPDARSPGAEHATAQWALQLLGDDFYAYHCFSIVRNPWDRMVSWFSHAQQQGWIARKRLGVDRFMSFAEFLESAPDMAWVPQFDYLCDSRGNMVMNDVFRFEAYREGVASICARWHLNPTALPHAKPSRHASYTTYYTERTRRIVADRFAKDIEYFGYTFGG